MPIFYVPDNTPSRNYGRNSRTEGYAHPTHGTIGVLAKSNTDPRNRGRRLSRDEIEAASRARYDAKKERLAKIREEVQAKEAERKQQESDKRDAARRLRHAKERDAYYAAHPEALAKREREEEWKREQQAKKGQPLKRLTPEEMAANHKAIMDRERAALESSRAEAKSKTATMDKLMSERMKPEGPSLSDTLAASETAGRKAIASNAYNTVFGQAAEAPAPAAPAAAPKAPVRRSVVASKSAPTSAATQSAGAAFAEASKANPGMTPSEFFASRPDLVASMQADQGITGAPSMPGPASKPSVKFDAFGNAKPQAMPAPLEAHAYYAATNPQVPGAIPDPFGQTMSYVNTGIDRGIEVARNIGNAAHETFFAPDKRAEITRAPARDPEVEALRQGGNIAKPIGQGGIAFDPTIRPDYKPEGPNWSPDMASGGSIDRPYDPKKIKTLADWLSGLIPDSFSDPNSMYYFPGKYN